MEVTRLLKKAENCYICKKYAESEKYASEGRIISKRIGDTEGEVRALRIQASSLYMLGEYKSCVEKGNELENIAVKVEDPKLTAEVYKFLSCSFLRMEEYQICEVYANKSLSIAKEIGDVDLERKAHHVLSMVKIEAINGNESPKTSVTFGDSFLEGDACMAVLINLHIVNREFSKTWEYEDPYLNEDIETLQPAAKAEVYEFQAQSYHPKVAPAVNRGLEARPREAHEVTYFEDDDDNDFRQSNQGSVAEEVKAVHPSRRGTEKVYNMTANPRGKALIINITKFERDWNPRDGSEGDVCLLKELFRDLFFVVETREDLAMQALKDELKRVSGEDHSRYDCFVVFIMSHGLSGAVVCSDGNTMAIQELRDTICECKTLTDKPKIFFIVACRGTLQDEGISVASDRKPSLCEVDNPPDSSTQQVTNTPTQADCLVVFSTVDRYVSYRLNGGGSIFVRCFVEAFRERVSSDDVDDVLKMVNYKVSRCEITSKEDDSRTFKQVPEVKYTLLKKLFL